MRSSAFSISDAGKAQQPAELRRRGRAKVRHPSSDQRQQSIVVREGSARLNFGDADDQIARREEQRETSLPAPLPPSNAAFAASRERSPCRTRG